MDWIGVVGILGTCGTFGFGILSLKQRATITGMRTALCAVTQTLYNNLWSVGNEAEQIISHVADLKIDVLDRSMILKRAAAVNSTSVAARHTVINLARHYADSVPAYEKAWSPQPMAESTSVWKRIFRSIGT
jgi:vacuolar-type H+-ATPase catalytic subunit A/Vma1